MLKGFKKLLKQTKILCQEAKGLDINNPNIDKAKKIEYIAIHNLKHNLELLISEIKVKELGETRLEVKTSDGGIIDFDELSFVDYDFNFILTSIQQVGVGLKSYYLTEERLDKNASDISFDELSLDIKYAAFYVFLIHIIETNNIFLNLLPRTESYLKVIIVKK